MTDSDCLQWVKFEWHDTFYKFSCFPNGLALCPRKFTKLLIVIFKRKYTFPQDTMMTLTYKGMDSLTAWQI